MCIVDNARGSPWSVLQAPADGWKSVRYRKTVDDSLDVLSRCVSAGQDIHPVGSRGRYRIIIYCRGVCALMCGLACPFIWGLACPYMRDPNPERGESGVCGFVGARRQTALEESA